MAGWMEKYRGYIILTLLYVAILGGVVTYVRRPEPEQPIVVQTPTSTPVIPTLTITPTITPAPITVYVSGAVFKPGVYTLSPGSRVHEAIQLAGGATSNADLTRINLADWLCDAQQIYVPKIGEENPPVPPVRQSAMGSDASGAGRSTGKSKININTASAQELETLPGIGPAYAERIIRYRQEHGPFQRIEDITQVKGIGPKTLEKIEDFITVR